MYVTNVDGKCVHWSIANPAWHHGLQKSNCGWFYMNQRFERSAVFTPGTQWFQVCKRCMKERRAAMKDAAEAPMSDVD